MQRAMKDIKDRSDELKTKGKEILLLRKDVKNLQIENSRILNRIRDEEAIQSIQGENIDLVQRMSAAELKTRLLKMAQAYKGKAA
jgi:hypothetical protein